MSSLLLGNFQAKQKRTVGIHSFGNKSTQNAFLKIIVWKMSLVLLFYPLRLYNGICQFSFLGLSPSYLLLRGCHSRYVEPCVTENWGRLKVWHQCLPHWNFCKWEIGYYWNLSEMKRQPLWEELEWPPKCLKVMLRKDWHDGHHVAAYQFCGARLVMPSDDSRGGLCQQLLREMMESGKTAEREIRRSTLRRHRDSNSVTRPDGWPNLLADGPAEKQKWGIIWVLGIMA